MLGLLLIVLCSGLAAIVIKALLLLLLCQVLSLLDERDINFSDTVYNAIVLFRWRIPDV